jgi:enediyne biosynthesis protein E4
MSTDVPRRAEFLATGRDRRAARIAVGWVAAGLVCLQALAAPGPAWRQEPGYRWAELPVPSQGQAGFTLMAPPSTGVLFTNVLLEQRHLTNQILLNGAGVAAGDVNGDGWCDLYFSHSWETNALFLNRGNWRFEAVPDAGGAGLPYAASTGATLADLDGDGDLDLTVNTLLRGTRLWFNDGTGRFTEAPSSWNLGRGPMTSTLADIDGDGDLDLYVSNYRESGLMDIPNARATFKQVEGRTVMETLDGRLTIEPDLTNRFVVGVRGDIQELGNRDLLLRNDGQQRFTEVPWTTGVFLDETGRPLRQTPADWGLTAAFRDLNGDGLPDLYVCNDFQTEDRFWINQGQGRFQLVEAHAIRRTSRFSMAVDFADLDRDGHDDFLVLDMMSRDHSQRMRYMNDLPPTAEEWREVTGRPQSEHNVLQLNRGDGTYAEIAQLAGLEAAEWAWACAFLDVDLDGYEDLLIANGMERAARDLDVADRIRAMRGARRMTDGAVFEARRMFPRLDTPNLAFRNRGDLTFEESGTAWGVDQPTVSHGLALADLDNDGDLDLVMNNLNGAAGVYRNNTTAPRVAVRLKGAGANPFGIGARVLLHGGPVPTQADEMQAGGRYLSGDDSVLSFAAGAAAGEMTLEVRWPRGGRSQVRGVMPNRIYVIAEPAQTAALPSPTSPHRGMDGFHLVPESGVQVLPGSAPNAATAGAQATLFEDVSERLGHRHVDEIFDDFARQPLLPRKLSQPGPGVAWGDLNGDGNEDLVIGAGRGGRLAVFANDGRGGFTPLADGAWNLPQTRDVVGLALVHRAGAGLGVLAAQSHYEDGVAAGSAVRLLDPVAGTAEEIVSASGSAAGVLAVADVDGDGVLDLFVAGSVIPGRYPAPASSRFFRFKDGRYQEDPEMAKVLSGIGLVNGAVFTDVDGDGDPDLVLACDWGSLRLLINDTGRFHDATEAWGLHEFRGWWTSVATGDFDGDGRPDLVAGNWGRNTRYEAFRAHPLELYYADFNQDNTFELVEAQVDPALGQRVPSRKLTALAGSLPFLRQQFRSHRAFSTASLEQVLGPQLKNMTRLTANWLDSTVFLNRGGRFEARPLPQKAQRAPAFGLCVGDVDGDGQQDLFLAQNFFANELETSRHDAGRGLWLLGSGDGTFRPLSGQVSGVKLYGEGRGAALCDFDRDGRLDLAVGQNAWDTGLFRNRTGQPGLRVRLHGAPDNPQAIGAAARLTSPSGSGPLQEWQAGAGYGSQDGIVKVLTAPAPATHLWVRWPGGQVQEVELPEGRTTGEITLRHNFESAGAPGLAR